MWEELLYTFLSMCKARLREVKTCLESHTALEKQNWHLNPGLSDLKSRNLWH